MALGARAAEAERRGDRAVAAGACVSGAVYPMMGGNGRGERPLSWFFCVPVGENGGMTPPGFLPDPVRSAAAACLIAEARA